MSTDAILSSYDKFVEVADIYVKGRENDHYCELWIAAVWAGQAFFEALQTHFLHAPEKTKTELRKHPMWKLMRETTHKYFTSSYMEMQGELVVEAFEKLCEDEKKKVVEVVSCTM